MTYNVKKTNCPVCGVLIFVRNDIKSGKNCKNEIRCHMCNSIVISWTDEHRNYSTDKLATNKTETDFVRYLDQLVKCPKCGGKLIERIGNKGRFWGCENYPKCRFIGNSNTSNSNQ